MDNLPDIDSQETISKPEIKQPILTINIYSWWTPVVAVLMLVTGLLIGFFGQPLLASVAQGDQPEVVINPVTQPSGNTQNTEADAAGQEMMAALVAQSRHFIGDPDAPVTMIEMSDFNCPYCQKFTTDTLPLLMAAYVDQGLLRIGFVHMAFLSPDSELAAQATECAAEQEAFWPYHEALYASPLRPFDNDVLTQIAGSLTLDEQTFVECLDESRYADAVASDLEFVRKIGARSTPSFLINGVPFIGAQPFEAFAQVIDQQLNQP